MPLGCCILQHTAYNIYIYIYIYFYTDIPRYDMYIYIYTHIFTDIPTYDIYIALNFPETVTQNLGGGALKVYQG